MKKIAKLIKEYRLSQGLTQLDLSLKISKSVRTIKRYEKGDTIPTIEILEAIFNESVQDILYTNLTKEESNHESGALSAHL